MDKRILIVLLICLMLLPLTSASTFDNIKGKIPFERNEKIVIGSKDVNYSSIWETYNPIRIENSFGLGKTLFEGAIIEHTANCWNSCSSVISIYIADDGALMDDIKFIGNINSYQLYVEDGTHDISVDDFSNVCHLTGKTLINGTKEELCEWKKTGSHTEKEPNWVEYSIGEIKTAGTYNIKLEGQKGRFGEVDWVMETQGKELTDWAVWHGAVPTVYYAFENDLTDTAGLADLTGTTGQFNSTVYKLGSYGRTYFGDGGGSQDYNNVNYLGNFELNDFTIAYWINTTDIVGETSIIQNANLMWVGEPSGAWGANLLHITGEARFIASYNGGTPIVTSTTSINDGQWHRVVITREGLGTNQVRIYVDGQNEANGTHAYSMVNGSTFQIGGGANANGGMKGTLDEVVIFNDTAWTPADVTLDWNGGAGAKISFSGNSELLFPANNSVIVKPYILFNCSYDAGTGETTTNLSLYSNYSGTWAFMNTTTGLTGQVENVVMYGLVDRGVYDFEWSCLGCSASNNCAYAVSNSTIKMRNVKEETQEYNANVTEGSTESFAINLTYDSSYYSNIYAYLNYNGTSSLGVKVGSGDNVLFNVTNSIPVISSASELKYFNWSIYLIRGATTYSINSTTGVQNISSITLTDCELTGGEVVMNMSLRDEEFTSLLNITPPNTAVIEINLELTSKIDGSIISEFSKIWNNNQTASVCIDSSLLGTASYRTDFTIGYEGTDYVKEFYFMDNGTLDNTGYFNSYSNSNISLFDLASADSTTFLFEFTDEEGLAVSNAIVHAFRKYIGEGIFREVERSKQDNNGQTHVHLVEEDVIYYFMITKDGRRIYTSSTYNAKCLSSPCEITLSASPESINWSTVYNEGGEFVVTTDKDTRIVTTSFSFDSLSLVNVSLYKLYDGTSTLINQSSLTAITGSIALHVPLVYNNATFYVDIYKDNVFVKPVGISLIPDAQDYFGTFGAILAGLLVLALLLMAVSEGAGLIIFTSFALIIIVVMGLADLGWVAVTSIILAGATIVWKIMNRRNKAS